MRSSFRAIIITGASSGLGAALAKAYAAPQTVLGLLGRDRQRLADTAKACEAQGAETRTAAIAVEDAAAMTSWLAEFDHAHPVDLLVANAGTSAGPEPESPSEGVETAARQIRVNLIGASQHSGTAVACAVRAQAWPGCDHRLDCRLSRLARQPRLLCEQGRTARLCRSSAAAARTLRRRNDPCVSRFFQLADDRPL